MGEPPKTTMTVWALRHAHAAHRGGDEQQRASVQGNHLVSRYKMHVDQILVVSYILHTVNWRGGGGQQSASVQGDNLVSCIAIHNVYGSNLGQVRDLTYSRS